MNPEFKARWAYKEGEGQEANPYPRSSPDWIKWALEMQKCQQEELHELMGWNHG